MEKQPDLHRGDRVSMDYCPSYPMICRHNATVTSEPTIKNGVWYVAVRYNCIGLQSANIPANHVIKLRGPIMKLSKPAITTGIVLVVVLFTGLWLSGNYNDLNRSRNQLNNSRARIDTAVQKRYETVDNIVASVKGSQVQEQKVFGAIANARKQGSSSGSTEGQAAANAQIDTQIALLPRLQEAYPELNSNDQMSKLIKELQDISVEVRDARNNYNDTATNYNTNVTSFPKNIFAGLFHFQSAQLYKADAAAQKNPKVDFGD